MSERTPGGARSTPAARREALRKLLTARAAGDARVLSAQQERLWVAHHLDPNDSSQNLRSAVHIQGPLDIGALEACFAELVRHHEQLRARFGERQGAPLARISVAGAVEIHRFELTGTSPSVGRAELEAERDRLIRQQASLPFDLERDSPIRLALLVLGKDDSVLVLTVHHIVCDAWSMDLLLRQLGELYAGAVESRPGQLPEPAASYAAFAEAQVVALADGSDAGSERFWQRQLTGYEAGSLLTRGNRPRAASRAPSSRLALDFSPALRTAVERLAAAHGATTYMVLLTAFGVLLQRISGLTDLVVASPVANREREEWEAVVGYFVNLLPLRIRSKGDSSFAEILGAVRQTVLDTHAHQQLPVHRIAAAAELRPATLLRVLYQHVAAPQSRIETGGVVLAPRPIDLGRTRHDLSLTTFVASERLQGALEYSRDLLDDGAAAQLIDDLESVLERVVAAPSTPVVQITVSLDWSGPDDEPDNQPAAELTGEPTGEPGTAVLAGGAAATSPTEANLGRIWESLLGLDSVSRLDNFLDIGGDSLLAMQVIERVENELGVRLAPADLFTQTLAQLAASCERRRG